MTTMQQLNLFLEKIIINDNNYFCQLCGYETNKKCNILTHIKSKKHQKLKIESIENLKKYKCECGLRYINRQNLYRHKKNCKVIKAEELLEKKCEENKALEQEIINLKIEAKNTEIKLLKEQNETLKNYSTTTINNTTNNTTNNNIILMLNERYKNAISLEDFIKTITFSLESINFTKDKGFMRGITNTLIENLKKLDKDKRPIYCTASKKDVLYIKNQGWEKDCENKHIINTINKIAFKQTKEGLPIWQDANPDFMDDEIKRDEFMKLLNIATMDIKNIDDQNKIAKNFIREIQNI